MNATPTLETDIACEQAFVMVYYDDVSRMFCNCIVRSVIRMQSCDFALPYRALDYQVDRCVPRCHPFYWNKIEQPCVFLMELAPPLTFRKFKILFLYLTYG